MQRVAVGVKADDLQPACVKFGLESLLCDSIAQHARQVEMRAGGPTAGIHLDPRHAQSHGIVEHLSQAHARQTIGYESKLHV